VCANVFHLGLKANQLTGNVLRTLAKVMGKNSYLECWALKMILYIVQATFFHLKEFFFKCYYMI